MDLIAAIKREERKLEKELGKLRGELSGSPGRSKSIGQQDEPKNH